LGDLTGRFALSLLFIARAVEVKLAAAAVPAEDDPPIPVPDARAPPPLLLFCVNAKLEAVGGAEDRT